MLLRAKLDDALSAYADAYAVAKRLASEVGCNILRHTTAPQCRRIGGRQSKWRKGFEACPELHPAQPTALVWHSMCNRSTGARACIMDTRVETHRGTRVNAATSDEHWQSRAEAAGVSRQHNGIGHTAWGSGAAWCILCVNSCASSCV